MTSKKENEIDNSGLVPPQRKSTLKWSSNGELSSIDMTRILYRLSNSELTKCELPSDKNSS